MAETKRINSKFENLDDIIIGSGAGGFTAALALANAGHKVLVIEQHKIPGGWSQSYKFSGHTFSPGVHDIAELGPQGRLRQIYEGLGMGTNLTFYEMNPDGYDHILLGDERFDVPSGKEKIIERLSKRFPKERKGLIKYFNLSEKIYKESEGVAKIDGLKSAVKAILNSPSPLQWSLKTGEQFVDKFVKDPLLKSMLYGQAAGHYALPPSNVSAVIHAAAVGSYLNGAWHPKGGGRGIVKAFIKSIRDKGGDIITGTRVEKIIVSKGNAIGVRTHGGDEIYAKNIVSNADPSVTFGQMVGKEHISSKLTKKLAKTKYSLSGLNLSIVTDKSLDTSHLDSGNYWYYKSTNVEGLYKEMISKDKPPTSDLPFFCLTTNSLRDPVKTKDGSKAFEVFTFMGYEYFNKWDTTKFGSRPEDYNIYKKELTDDIIKSVEKIIPSLSKHILALELGTPLTNVHYVEATKGNFYGTEKSRFQIGPWGYTADTEINNLKLCGASTFAHGIVGASITGLLAASSILKCETDDLLNYNNGNITFLSAEEERKIIITKK